MRDLTTYTATTVSPDTGRIIDLTTPCNWCGLDAFTNVGVVHLCPTCWEWVLNERRSA